MEINWVISKMDLEKLKSFYDTFKSNPFVLNRIERNIERRLPKISRSTFWEAMISCLITSQQRSGPDSAVTRFISTKPFPLRHSECEKSDNLREHVEEVITSFRGLRRGKRIGEEVEYNFRWLENNGWTAIEKMIEELAHNRTYKLERGWAETISDNLKGFGPKQSRNLLQSLGLTRYEIPIDSRITKWLNNFGFPLRLSATALTDKNYYNFVMDGFQKLCEAAGIYPCAMDAAIFVSFDCVDWTDDNLIW